MPPKKRIKKEIKIEPTKTTRLLRTAPYHALGVILHGSDYVDFNESTLKNAQKILQNEHRLQARRRKAAERKPAFEVVDEKEPNRLMEEFQAFDDFEFVIERHKPETYVLDGRKVVEKVDDDIEILKIREGIKPKILNDTVNASQSDLKSIKQESFDQSLHEASQDTKRTVHITTRRRKDIKPVIEDLHEELLLNQSIVDTGIEEKDFYGIQSTSSQQSDVKEELATTSREIFDRSEHQRTQDTSHVTTRKRKEIDNPTLHEELLNQSIVNTGIEANDFFGIQSTSSQQSDEELANTAIDVSSHELSSISHSLANLDEEDRTEFIETLIADTPLDQLLAVCKQDDIIPFDELLDFNSCTKIGEGTFGEVFKAKIDGQDVALKIVPFTAEQETKPINGDFMKSAASILPEAVISQQLTLLAKDYFGNTTGFVNVVQMRIVKGNYPEKLLKAWDTFKAEKDEQVAVNDSPTEYSNDDQLYIAIALRNGGQDLETYKAKNENEALSILLQIITSLRIAEEHLEFEHRDLHVGNVLVRQTKKNEVLSFTVAENEIAVKSYGIVATIIDFTNSRISKDGMTIFVDLSTDFELFLGPDEYQFQVYRNMKRVNNNDWSIFTPQTNCQWIHYLSTMILPEKGIRVKRRKELQLIFDQILGCTDLNEFMQLESVNEMFEAHFLDPNT